jgi:hypothetical protein
MRIHDGFCRKYRQNQSGDSHRPGPVAADAFAEREGWIVMHTHIFALLEVLATLLG